MNIDDDAAGRPMPTPLTVDEQTARFAAWNQKSDKIDSLTEVSGD